MYRELRAHQRSGPSVSDLMLEKPVRPGFALDSPLDLRVWIVSPSGDGALVGTLPGRVMVPPHRFLWIQAEVRDEASLGRVVDFVVAQRIPGVQWLLHELPSRALVRELDRLDQVEALSVDAHHLQTPRALRPLANLEFLELWGSAPTAYILEALAVLPRLAGLKMYTTGGNLSALQSLCGLRCLDLSDSGSLAHSGAADLPGLGDLAGLTSLRLGRCWGVTDAAMTEVARLTCLERLDLEEGSYQITDAGLARLATLPALRSLNLKRCHGVTARGLSLLARLGTLESLDLSWTALDDAALAAIATGLKSLRRLAIRGCDRVTRVETLDSLDHLEHLDVSWCPLRAGVVRGIRDTMRVVRTDPRVRLESLDGNCPVQGVGDVAGKGLYFRARHRNWTFAVARRLGEDGADVYDASQGFYREGEYGEGPHDAGYMPYDHAESIIRRCLEEYFAESG